MKVVLINKSASGGGAAMACKRLLQALRISKRVHASMLVQEYSGNDLDIKATTTSFLKRKINFLRFVWERICFLPHERSKEVLFAFSLANTGENLSNFNEVQQADIIHLHWFNQAYMSLNDLKKLTKLNKPIVWTLHDMWSFTGGCHYSGDCRNFETACHHCPFLKNPSRKDLSSKIFRKKLRILKSANITYVGCSAWMAEEARKSSTAGKSKVINIPNPIDTSLYKPLDKDICRQKFDLPLNKKIILFGAAKISDKRKGLIYLVHAIELLNKSGNGNYLLVTFGKTKDMPEFAIESRNISYIGDESQIIQLYNTADVFVVPSLEDNLPNTIMEALACGIPVASFRTGGIPEMVDHQQNGYLAALADAVDLAKGIQFITENHDYARLSENARQKVLNSYSEALIAQKYFELYTSLLHE